MNFEVAHSQRKSKYLVMMQVAVALLVALVNAAPFKSRGQQQPGASSASSSSPFYAAYGGDDDYGFGQSAGYSRFGGYPSYYGHNPYASYGFNRHRPYGYSAPSAYGGGYPYGVGAWTGNFGYPQNPFRFASPQVNGLVKYDTTVFFSSNKPFSMIFFICMCHVLKKKR